MSAVNIVMDSRKAMVEKMIELIKGGSLNWERGWNVASLSPANPVSHAVYKGGNRLRLMINNLDRGYQDPRYMTYVQAQKMGWQVKKGEKGTLCEKYIFTKEIKEKDPDTGEEKKVLVELDKPIINYFYVYNAEQIEGIPEMEKAPENTDETNLDLMELLIKAAPCPVKEEAQPHAYYSPSRDEIVLPPRKDFKSNADFMKTLAHEEIHSSGHKTRLNRELSGIFGSESYAREELRAELGSMFLMADIGLSGEGKVQENHAAYLQSWLGALKDDPTELFKAASDAEKAADYLFKRFEIAKSSEITATYGCEKKEKEDIFEGKDKENTTDSTKESAEENIEITEEETENTERTGQSLGL